MVGWLVIGALVGLPIVVKLVTVVAGPVRRSRARRTGWAGYVMVDNASLFRSPGLRQAALREGKVVPVFGRTPKADGVVFGWLYVDREIRFKPGRLSRGGGARSFRLTREQIDEVRASNDRISLHLQGEAEPINIGTEEPTGLAEAATRLKYHHP